jgi:hypothetical protein
MKAHVGGRTKDKTLLISMGESIGSTLGAIAGRAHAVKKALSGSSVSRTVKQEGRKLVKKVKSAGRKTSRRRARRSTSSAKRSAGRARSKA